MIDKETIEDMIVSFIAGLTFLAISTCPFWIMYVTYNLNKAECSVWVGPDLVYNGRCHFVSVEPVGEYGASKRVKIYSDVYKLHKVGEYVSDNVEVKDAVK